MGSDLISLRRFLNQLASLRTKERTRHIMRDSEIEQWVLRELRQQRNGSSKEICVYATDGIATLTGSVRTRYEKSAAQKAALRAEAVIAVVNHLKVLRPEAAINPSPLPVRNRVRLQANQHPLPTRASVAGTQPA